MSPKTFLRGAESLWHGEDGGLQALAAWPLQKGRRLRVPARVQPEEDARVLVLCKVRGVPEPRVPLPPHRSQLKGQGVSVVCEGLLQARANVQEQACQKHGLSALPQWILPLWAKL